MEMNSTFLLSRRVFIWEILSSYFARIPNIRPSRSAKSFAGKVLGSPPKWIRLGTEKQKNLPKLWCYISPLKFQAQKDSKRNIKSLPDDSDRKLENY